MIVASQRQPVILEGELPGGIQKTRASATGCPALRPPPPFCSLERDRAAGQPHGCRLVIARWQIGNWLWQTRHSFRALSGLKRSFCQSATRQHRNPRAMRLGWLARAAFFLAL